MARDVVRRRSRRAAWFVLACTAVTALSGRPEQGSGPPRPEAQIAAIARLDYMVGKWSGAGWIDVGGRKMEFRGTETVQRKLDGSVLLVEGRFLAKPPGATAEVPVHTTLGVISFDPQTKTYQFTTWLATGASGERELMLTTDGWRWHIKSDRGEVRYTMRLTESGEWFEIGERSSDGQTWQKFFEMRLQRSPTDPDRKEHEEHESGGT